MVDEEFTSRFKQRFKGVENFLRRVAFNLGNTPSQTEVKIISCIPIDITDLQNKIISLEKQLEDARKRPKSITVAAADLECRHCLPEPSTFYEMNKPNQSPELNKESDVCGLKRSRLSCINPNVSKTNTNTLANEEHKKNAQVYYKFNENNKGIFKKVKKKKDLEKSDNFKTHLVYYAQTTNSPFNNYNANIKSRTRDISNRNNQRHNSRSYMEEMIRSKHEPRPILDDFTDESYFPEQARGNNELKMNYNEHDDTHSYLQHMIRKQYEPRSIPDEFSNSTFSSPICRDNERYHTTSHFDFDSCSCCHGTFHNIDNLNHSTDNHPPTHTFNENFSERSFYDSSFYDMVPVKEIPTKVKKNGVNYERKQKITGLNIMYPPIAEPKSKNNTLIINYHTLPTMKHKSPKISPTKVTNKKEINMTVPKRHAATATSVGPIEVDTSKSCCIDFGNVYMKRVHKKHNPPKMIQTKKSLPLFKNAECLATNIVNTDCQTTATQSIEIDDHKTEQTLNQIKCILQSVLTEVKTNTQKRNSPHEKNTKDAVVQKGTSRGYVPGCSDLLNSYTYSTLNMSPCFRQLNSNQYCSNLPYNAMKCMHNFPAFIRTPNQNMCSSCYRNTTHLAKASYPRPTITAATNTNNNKEHNEETEMLIKEIYKSIAPNLDVPIKDTSTSENNDLRSDKLSISPSTHANKKLSHNTGVTIKSTTKTSSNTPINTSLTPLSMNTSTTNPQSNTMSMHSQIASTTDTDRHLRNDRIEKLVQNKNSKMSIKSVRAYELSSEDVVISEYTELSDDETEDTGEQLPTKHNKKENIFTKMFKSVKLFKNKHKQEQPERISESEEEDDNDSDYETIYSQKIDRVRYLSQNHIRRLPHSKISYSRQIRDRHPEKIVPNTDQEYRRQWAERLMLHDDQPKYFSEQPSHSRDTSKRKERQGYWQNYETRNAIIEQNGTPAHSKEDYTSGTPYSTSNM